MTAERWQEVKAVLAGALERTPEQRRVYLDQACTDPTLRREVESLIAAHDQGDTNSLDQPPAAGDVPLQKGTQLGQYTILSRIGSGGMGEVYQAHDTKLTREVAIKVLPRTFVNDPGCLARFQREARLLASLNHPNIATIHELAQAGEVHFLVMELIEGQTLAERVSAGPLNCNEVLAIGGQVAEALEAAHQKGVIHRDLKPANVKVTPEGRVKVLDFGLAKALAGDTDLDLSHAPTLTAMATQEGRILGTPAYMSPEQARGKLVDKRTDVWAFGCLLYELLTARRAFPGETLPDTIVAVLEKEPSWQALPPTVPVQIRELLRRCLQKDPQRRLRDLGDARIEIAEVLAPRRDSSAVHVSGSSTVVEAAKQRKIGLVATAALVLVLFAAAGTLAYRHYHTPRITKDDWILMTDFTNRSGQPLFDDTVGEAFRSALEQSHSVRVVPRAQAVEAARLLGQSQVVNIAPTLGREICQRGNCRVIATGEVTSVGSAYQIRITLEDPWRNMAVFTEQAALQSPAELYPTVDRLVRGLREHLGESLAEVQKTSTPLDKVTTPSLAALQRYTRARNLYDAGDLDGAVLLAKSASELDPDFPMCHVLLLQAYDELGNARQTAEQLDLAMSGLDRVTERERYLVQAINYASRHLYERAAGQYSLLTELYSDDLLAYQGLAAMLRIMGRYEDSVQAEQHALELSPDSASDYNYLITTLDRLNHFPEALKAFSAAQARGIRSPLLHWGAGVACLGQGNTEGATREFELLKQGGDYDANLASFFQTSLLMYRGRLAEATEELRSGIVLGEKLGSESSVLARRVQLAETLAIRGRHAEALAETRKLASQARAQADPSGLEAAGITAAELGDLGLGRQLLAQLDELRSREQGSAFLQSCYYTLKGGIELANADPKAAITSARAALVYFAPAYDAAAVLAQAYAREHNWPEAVEAYRRYLDFQGQAFFLGATTDWVVSNVQLARVLVEAGQTDEALRFYDRFLGLWSGADAGLPIVKQARAERQRIDTIPHTKGNADSGPNQEDKTLRRTTEWQKGIESLRREGVISKTHINIS